MKVNFAPTGDLQLRLHRVIWLEMQDPRNQSYDEEEEVMTFDLSGFFVKIENLVEIGGDPDADECRSLTATGG